MAKTAPTPPPIREFGRFNTLGLWTLYTKEVRRFMRVAPQTILAPIVSNLLYMTVFVLAFAEQRGDGSADFIAFLAPGLVMLGILNNASSNSSSSIMTGKPVTRGLMVALFTAAALSLFTSMIPVVLWPVLYFSLAAAMMLGMIGILSGIWAEKFDQLAVVNQFIILPLSFLSGTFYHIDILPEFFRQISLANPLFYLIDGFRYGFIGTADGNVMIGVAYTLILNIILFFTCLRVLKSGWRLKA